MLLGANYLLRYLQNYRVCWLGGRYGGGKTSLAFRLAYELLSRTDKYRYLLSNVQSVWNDEPKDVVLREGRFVDAIIILDEAGSFMATRSQVTQWLEFLRKLNLILLLPSVLPPSSDVRFLSLRRHFNGYTVGIPYWHYRAGLESGDISEKLSFGWWLPHEIYGIYDTDGFPSDADEILTYVKQWTSQAAANRGYTKTAAKKAYASIFAPGVQRPDPEQVSTVDLEGAIDDLTETTAVASRTISALARKTSKRR